MAAKRIEWWQKYGNIAQIGSALFAFLGFVAVIYQLNEIKNNNRATSARQVYLAYADVQFKYPLYADPDYEKLKASGKEAISQYQAYVAYMLYACGEVLHAFPKDSEWEASCSYDVVDHLPFLCEKEIADSDFMKTFGLRTQQFVREEMARNGVAPPECKVRKS
ncbi:MAG TPA: hypothetical protein VNR41_06535 [Xanthobacteraceae bacterium]|jgi:hypothetical protein|nr:hypothetical protein [Xanthobacteraceae bacterium]